MFDLVVREGDLLGRRVLDIGCGTGRLTRALAGRARVWGVDASPRMLEIAKARPAAGARFKLGTAEDLPFRDAWFERAVMWLLVHLIDRTRAFAELRRVLAPGGRAVVVTFDPSHFDRYWLNGLFPSLEAIDRGRFPTAAELAKQLEGERFTATRVSRVGQAASLDREAALSKIRGRHISTFDLLDEAEYEEGLARAERELPERFEYRLEWLVVVTERAA